MATKKMDPKTIAGLIQTTEELIVLSERKIGLLHELLITLSVEQVGVKVEDIRTILPLIEKVQKSETGELTTTRMCYEKMTTARQGLILDLLRKTRVTPLSGLRSKKDKLAAVLLRDNTIRDFIKPIDTDGRKRWWT